MTKPALQISKCLEAATSLSSYSLEAIFIALACFRKILLPKNAPKCMLKMREEFSANFSKHIYHDLYPIAECLGPLYIVQCSGSLLIKKKNCSVDCCVLDMNYYAGPRD